MVIDKVSTKLTDKWTSPKISKDQWEIYNYGLQLLLTYVVIIVLIGALSLVFHQFWLTMLYLLGFLVQRYISGGYHAKDDVHCIGLTVAVCLAFNLVALYLPAGWLNGVNIALFMVSAVIIWLLAPVDYAGRFNSADYIQHKRRGRLLIGIYMAVLAMGLIPVFTIYANALLWGYFTASVSIFCGYYHKKGVK